ncbi:MAG: CoA-binding protein [Cytophagaceae bacterium]|jgi:hypothetical protein|nr:CoA-binding protein [Cytophagaceae bacterium]
MKVVLIGATNNPDRYAYECTLSLIQHGHEVILKGIKTGEVAGIPIQRDKTVPKDVHTITLYIGPQVQEEWLDFIEQVQPKRVIFNPGTENDVAFERLKTAGIQYEQACTLVLLSTRQFEVE